METAPPLDVLLADDDDAVRGVISEMLAAEGYEVAAAADGPEALALARTRRFHILVTDTVMPAMDGFELAAELTRLDPGLRVLFTSGFAAVARDGAAGFPPTVGFLRKPFTQAELAAALARLA
jgi:CheY-like chemotaxis protein